MTISRDLPQVCYFCEEEISEHGRHSESLTIHSLDGNHDNWEPSNKVPSHKRCHRKHHSENPSLGEEYRKPRKPSEMIYTTLFIYKTTRVRFQRLKGRGRTADYYLNELMDMVSQEQTRDEQEHKAGDGS